MKKLISGMVVTLALTTAINAQDFYASVDGEKITKEDVALVLQDPRANFEALPKKTQTMVLEQIINKKLLAKEAIKNGVEKDPVFINAINKMKSDLAFQVWQRNEVTNMKISDKDQIDFYEKNKEKFKMPATLEARHILVETEDAAKALIKELDASKNKEEKFIDLAKTKSTGPSGPKGGYLGKFQEKQMVPEFSAAAKKLAANSYTKMPVKTQFGYHIIYLVSKNDSKSLSFNEVKGNISKIIVQERYNKKVKALTDSLRKKAKIVIK